LTELYEKTKEIDIKQNIIIDENSLLSNKKNDQIKAIEILQEIMNKLLLITSGFGTKNMKDLLYIIFDDEFENLKFENELIKSKFESV
jgi:hypothetical protein